MRPRRAACGWLPVLAWLLALTAALSSDLGFAAGASDAGKAKAELAEITRQLNDLATWFGAADRETKALQQAIAESDRAVAAASKAASEAAARVSATNTRRAELEAETAVLRERQARQAREVANHLGAAHRLAGEDFFKLILNQQSPEQLDRMVRYHARFSEARLKAMRAYHATLTELASHAAQLQQEAAAASELQQEAQARQSELAATRETQKQKLAEMRNATRDKAAERERLEADRSRLEKLVAELTKKASGLDGRSFSQSRGKLPWPIEGRVLHAFGTARAEGGLTWDGVLIAAEDGTVFRAVQAGKVIFADWLRGYGLLLIVDHGAGFMTLYGQAESLAHGVGDRVEAGTALGLTGRSGGQQQAGLYFEIRQNGTARDPIGWLRKR